MHSCPQILMICSMVGFWLEDPFVSEPEQALTFGLRKQEVGQSRIECYC